MAGLVCVFISFPFKLAIVSCCLFLYRYLKGNAEEGTYDEICFEAGPGRGQNMKHKKSLVELDIIRC